MLAADNVLNEVEAMSWAEKLLDAIVPRAPDASIEFLCVYVVTMGQGAGGPVRRGRQIMVNATCTFRAKGNALADFEGMTSTYVFENVEKRQ